jgi:hypothetical protein
MHGLSHFKNISLKFDGYLFLQPALMSNETTKTTIMKFVKFGALALALGMFAASCGSESNTTETTTTDTTVVAPVEAAPAPATTTMDTTTVAAPAAAGMDTAAKMSTSTTTTEVR